MSELITLSTGESETIHGTFVAAKAYVAIMFGESYDTWRNLAASGALTVDDRKKQTLAAAVRLLNAQAWAEAYDTFAERDLIAAFATAEYELAVIIANDPTVLAVADQGSNIKTAYAAGAGVEYFNPTTKGAALLPPILMRLLGSYLATTTTDGPDGGSGCSSSADNPFSDCEDLDRNEPY